MGDFNGHLSELDGWEDSNGRRLLWLAEELQLEVLNLRSTCEGQFTWCARGSKTCIDYALASHRLGKSIARVLIDEGGEHSLGSDHNRLRLDFSKATWKKTQERYQRPRRTYLSKRTVATIMETFENSESRKQATGYQAYITVLKDLIKRHAPKRLAGRRRRKRWWDGEVKAAIHARQEANLHHRMALRTGETHEIDKKWHSYQVLKNSAKQLVQQKIRTADLAIVRDIRCSGRDAPRKFWAYLGTLDGRDQEAVIIDESTGEEPSNLGTHLSDYLRKNFTTEEDTSSQPTVHTAEHSQEEVIGWVTVLRAFAHLKTSTSPGLDGIPASVLKSMGTKTRQQMAEIFSAIFSGSEPVLKTGGLVGLSWSLRREATDNIFRTIGHLQ
ncbi:uncharacterized protein ISCGN_019491 [Ixodes scapularis]